LGRLLADGRELGAAVGGRLGGGLLDDGGGAGAQLLLPGLGHESAGAVNVVGVAAGYRVIVEIQIISGDGIEAVEVLDGMAEGVEKTGVKGVYGDGLVTVVDDVAVAVEGLGGFGHGGNDGLNGTEDVAFAHQFPIIRNVGAIAAFIIGEERSGGSQQKQHEERLFHRMDYGKYKHSLAGLGREFLVVVYEFGLRIGDGRNC